MQEFAENEFSFLNLKEREDVHLKLTVVPINDYTWQLKLFYQEPGVSLGRLEVMADDYYRAIEIATKKLNSQLKKINRKKTNQSKLQLGKALLDCESGPIEADELADENRDQLIETDDLKVPIYFMSIDEALEQMNCLGYNTLMYFDDILNANCVLVRQKDNRIKRYIGVLA